MLLVCAAIGAPPLACVYQRYSPLFPPEALNVTGPGPQDAPPVATGIERGELTCANTDALELSQVPL